MSFPRKPVAIALLAMFTATAAHAATIDTMDVTATFATTVGTTALDGETYSNNATQSQTLALPGFASLSGTLLGATLFVTTNTTLAVSGVVISSVSAVSLDVQGTGALQLLNTLTTDLVYADAMNPVSCIGSLQPCSASASNGEGMSFNLFDYGFSASDLLDAPVLLDLDTTASNTLTLCSAPFLINPFTPSMCFGDTAYSGSVNAYISYEYTEAVGGTTGVPVPPMAALLVPGLVVLRRIARKVSH